VAQVASVKLEPATKVLNTPFVAVDDPMDLQSLRPLPYQIFGQMAAGKSGNAREQDAHRSPAFSPAFFIVARRGTQYSAKPIEAPKPELWRSFGQVAPDWSDISGCRLSGQLIQSTYVAHVYL